MLAAEIGIPLMYVRFDALVSSYLGETASNIRKVFDLAKSDSFVILFDEFDAIGRSRSDTSEHGEIKRVVNTFYSKLIALGDAQLLLLQQTLNSPWIMPYGADLMIRLNLICRQMKKS